MDLKKDMQTTDFLCGEILKFMRNLAYKTPDISVASTVLSLAKALGISMHTLSDQQVDDVIAVVREMAKKAQALSSSNT